MEFTESEVAFIEATQPVLLLSEAMLVLGEEYQAAATAAEEAAEAIGEEVGETGGSAATRVHELVLEAARRVGFDDDHRVVVGINQGYAELQQYEELMDQLAEEVARREARELLGITDDLEAA